MSSSETRALRRAAYALLALSFMRWASVAGHAAGADAPDGALDSLLAAESSALDENERRRAPLGPGDRIDPNRASAVELDRLPGVGPSTAAAIVAFRESGDPFQVAGDLQQVPGLGPSTVARLAPFLDFAAPLVRRRDVRRRPSLLDVNRASGPELEELPGIGPALAGRILAARRERPFSSLDDLVRVPGIGNATLVRLRPLLRVGPRQ